MFPYHYGSHATEMMGIWIFLVASFPYHYGSHATKDSRWVFGELQTVSIPLWFSRNEIRVSCKLRRNARFHTTMVLTQKSRPPSSVPDHGPVLRKSKRAVPARCAQVLRSDASRPRSWLEEHREYVIKREDETEERVLVSEANSRSFSQLSMLHSPRS